MKHVTLNSIKELNSFIRFEEPIGFNGFKAIGYFPYEVAQLDYQECVAVPRNVFSEIEIRLSRTRYMDNKVVIVFEDLTNFDTTDFAIQFKDSYCKIGRLDQIVGYGGKILK